MTKVVVVQELLAQYRLPFYDQLQSELQNRSIDLELVHGRAAGERALRGDEARLPWARQVSNRKIGGRRGAHAVWQPVLAQVRGADLVVVEHANRQLVNYALLAMARTRAAPPVAFWGHGGNLQAAKPDSPPERFKRWTATLAHWWFAYTEGSAERVISAGFPRDRITVVQNAIDTTAYQAFRNTAKNAYECVFLGSLHEHKRVEFLLEAAESIASRLPAFRLTVIGDGPQRSLVERWAATSPWLDYRGAQFNDSKAALVSRASLMLMPGLVGLGVLDAFAARTPLITTAVPFHSPEFEYINDQGNGIVLPRHTPPINYADCVTRLLQEPERLAALRDGCAQSANTYTLESMVSNFAEGISGACSRQL